MIELPSAEDTRALGRALGELLRAGDLIVLSGPLGAGKTVFAQGIGAGLGVPDRVVSPTFVLARVHRRGRVPLVHVDAYRLGSVAEIDDMDLDADLADSVTVVEWGGGLVEQLADAHLVVRLDRSGPDETRTAELVPHGGDWCQRVAAVTETAAARGLVLVPPAAGPRPAAGTDDGRVSSPPGTAARPAASCNPHRSAPCDPSTGN